MKTLTKCLISLLLTALLLAVAFSAFAEDAFQSTINSFEYNGVYIPKYNGELAVAVNGNEPRFEKSELNQSIYENYSNNSLDMLGRVGVCSANIDQSLMPTQARDFALSYNPTGWQQAKYGCVSGGWLYNRSHLIGWQLTGEKNNKYNLMTGTRSFNFSGMLPYEDEAANYIKQNSENNVLYRVTPVFTGNDLLAKGVIMEAESVDDLGASVKYCVFVYNVQNGVSIDYSTGNSIEIGKKTDISNAYIWLKALNYQYKGKPVKPLDYVKVGGNVLKQGTDYTVQYTNNIKAGTARVTVYGIGAYSGSCSKTFKIYNPKPKKPYLSKLTAGKKSFTVKWNKVSGVSGYQLQYSTKKNFKGAKKLTVNSTKAVSKKVKSLKSKKLYYVRIRSYKTVAGTKFYSDWSKTKTIKTK